MDYSSAGHEEGSVQLKHRLISGNTASTIRSPKTTKNVAAASNRLFTSQSINAHANASQFCSISTATMRQNLQIADSKREKGHRRVCSRQTLAKSYFTASEASAFFRADLEPLNEPTMRKNFFLK